MSRKKSEPPFEADVMLHMWVTIPLRSKTWAEAVEEAKTVTIEDARTASEEDTVDARVAVISVRDREALNSGL